MPDDNRTLEIDFLSCVPQKERVYITYGSFAYELVGKNGDSCKLRYGGEVENPNWENLTTVCNVPTSIGKKEFTVKDLGVNFSSIKEYCKETSISVTRTFDIFSIVFGGILIACVLVGLVLAIRKIRR